MSKREDIKDPDLILNIQDIPLHSANPNLPYHQGQQLMTMDPPILQPNSRKRNRGQANMQGGGATASSSSNMMGGGTGGGMASGGHMNQGGQSGQGGFGADIAEGSSSMASPKQPPPKKSRTNTPWSPAEEQRLKTMRDAQNSWAEIAKTFPSRTEGSVKKHWYKDMHYAEFAEDESAALLNAIKDYETNKWKVIGQKVGKPAKACEQYAKEHFGNRV